MKPIPVQQPRFQQTRAVMMLDDAEMALNLIDLADTTTVKDSWRTPAAPVQSADLLTELYAAANMIMDREECEALVREIEQFRRTRPVAA